jgi:hypothetical protein
VRAALSLRAFFRQVLTLQFTAARVIVRTAARSPVGLDTAMNFWLELLHKISKLMTAKIILLGI